MVHDQLSCMWFNNSAVVTQTVPHQILLTVMVAVVCVCAGSKGGYNIQL